MRKLAIVLVLGLVGGFAVARFVPGPPDGAPGAPPPAAGVDASSGLAERVAELERAVSDERQARQVLEEEVFYLTSEIERLQAVTMPPGRSVPTGDLQPAAPDLVAGARRGRPANRDSSEARVARLVDGGFAPDRAEWIVQRESRFRMAMLEARHEAQRNGGPVEGFQEQMLEERQSFRADLGQADYERYLEATGRPTAVVVTSVMDTSPAQRVGLRPGDRIVSYGNMRIYSMSDLNRETLAGEAGETVFVQIERDGVPMQIALPRGPVGITGGGR